MGTKQVVFVLGPPGAGKDTQCRRIAHVYGFVLISVGEILRAEVSSAESPYREEIETCMRNGKIVSAETTCKLLERHLQTARKTNFLIVGFPRNEENREGWYRVVGNRISIAFVLFIECPEDVCMDRCLNRDSGRLDDKVEVLEKRFNTFITETRPTISCFDAQRLLRTVNGNQTEDKVFRDIKAIFEKSYFIPVDK